MSATDPRLQFATAQQKEAFRLIDEFAKKPLIFVWQLDDKKGFCEGMKERVIEPGLIDQGSAGLCGPASTLFDIVSRDPVGYVKFIVELYEKGKASYKGLKVEPGRSLRISRIPVGVPAVDWIPMAALRNSENEFFRYAKDKDYFAGITMPHEIVSWLKALGYAKVVNKTNLLFDARWRIAEAAARHYDQGDRVLLFINGKMLYGDQMTRGSLTPNHWVVLNSPLNFNDQEVWFNVFSWGNPMHPVPPAGMQLSRKDFLDNFYGFVAAAL